jgi:hypothetical protein
MSPGPFQLSGKIFGIAWTEVKPSTSVAKRFNYRRRESLRMNTAYATTPSSEARILVQTVRFDRDLSSQLYPLLGHWTSIKVQ